MRTIDSILAGKKGVHDVLSAPPATSVAEAARAMHRHGVGALVVRSGNGPVQGIFTERDLLARVVAEGRDPQATPLSAVMTAQVRAIAAQTTAQEALRLMVEHHYRHLLVSEGDRVVGLISVRDLMHAYVLADAAPPHEGRPDVLRARAEDALRAARG